MFSQIKAKKKVKYLKSQSHSKPQKNYLSISQQKQNYTQIKTSQYHSLNKSQGHSFSYQRKPSLSISTTSPSISKQITSKKNASTHNRSFSINQSLNNSKISPSLNLTTANTSSNISNNLLKRKKILSVNVNPELVFTDSNVKEKPLKLYNDTSCIATEGEIGKDIVTMMNELEKKLTINLSLNKTNSKSMKYNTIKQTFEELIKKFPFQNQKLLIKLLKGYHEVVLAFANENKSLKEINEVKQTKFLSLDKEQIELRKMIKNKEKEIELLKQKLKEKNPSEQIISKSTNESMIVSSGGKEQLSEGKKEKDDRNDYIEILNQNNIEDLDALYFFDKVKMNSDSNDVNTSVPRLNFQFEEQINKNKKRCINKTNLNNHSMNNIKFKKNL